MIYAEVDDLSYFVQALIHKVDTLHYAISLTQAKSCSSKTCFVPFLPFQFDGAAPTICNINSSSSPPIVGLCTVIMILDTTSRRTVRTGGGGETPAKA